MNKKIFKFTHALLLSFTLIIVSGCGDIFMNKVESQKESYNQFATCKFDFKAISQILKKNIKGDLLCLRRNLYLFMGVVESSQPGHLSQKELKVYIQKNMPEVDSKTLGILTAVFEFNSLMFGDDINYISKENVEKLAEILIEFNRIFVEGELHEFFSSKEKIAFSEHDRRKSIVYNSFIEIGKLFHKYIEINEKEIVILDFIKKFQAPENKTLISYFENFSFAKKMILGGVEEKLTSKELKRMMSILGDMGKVIFDLVDLPNTEVEASEGGHIMMALKEDLHTVSRHLFYKKTDKEILLTYEQVKKAIAMFLPGVDKIVKYKASFLKAKEIVLGSGKETFSASEVHFLFTDFLLKNISKGVFVYRSYLNEQKITEKKVKISSSLENLETFNEAEKGYARDFNRILKDYRFYHGSSFAPLYDFTYSRNPKGLFDIMVFEDLSKRFFKYYGVKDKTAIGGYSISQKKLEVFMLDFQEIFEGEKYILPGRAKNSAETITLMTSLFHGQSDGDLKIEIPEFVEFVITMTTSLKLAEEMFTYMKKVCPLDEQGRVGTPCYRENFKNFLSHRIDNNQKIDHYIPLLKEYIFSLSSPATLEKYLVDTSKFSRRCTEFNDGTEVPMAFGDFFVSWAGLLAIEQSMLRFDLNNSGALESFEVNEAYYIYKNAVEGMIPIESLKKYSRDFFKYLVKFRKVPEAPKNRSLRAFWRAFKDAAHFISFQFSSDNSQASSANRMTFAAVLRIIAENSPANIANPYPCETLRVTR